MRPYIELLAGSLVLPAILFTYALLAYAFTN